MHCPYINGLDSVDYRFLLVVTSPWESAIFVVITVNRRLSYLGRFFHRQYILPCRYRCTIHEYWSSWHWCHIQEKKHRIRQCLEQQTYWLMKKNYWRAFTHAGPNMWRWEYSFRRECESFFPFKFIFFSSGLISLNLSVNFSSVATSVTKYETFKSVV